MKFLSVAGYRRKGQMRNTKIREELNTPLQHTVTNYSHTATVIVSSALLWEEVAVACI
jgi:hypothetical protein